MAFSLDSLQQVRWKNLAKVFSLLPGDKVLLVDADLLNPLDRVITMPVLKRLGVTKVFKLADMPPKADISKLAYLLPPTYASVEVVCKHHAVDKENGISRTKLVIFVPRETEDVRYLLESRGLCGRDICCASLSLSWIPLDSDLITLNLPILYADYYLHGDYTWPQFMGRELGELLDVACESELAPMGCRVHAFGEAAEAVASGVRLYCLQSGLVQDVSSRKSDRPPLSKSVDRISDLSSQSSATSSSIDAPPASSSQLQSPPLVLIFSRNLDYVTPMLVPLTFEALIHENLGIDLGLVQLSESQCPDKSLRKQLLHGEILQYYKEVRDAHISTVFSKLEQWGSKLQDTRSGLEFEMATRLPTKSFSSTTSSPTPSITSQTSNTSLSDLKYFGSQVGPLMAKRRELSFLLIVLEQIMDQMTKRERVEDVRAAQTILLRSGSGGSLAMTTGPISSDTAGVGVTSSGDTKLTVPAAGGPCGTAADDTASMPIRLVIEWLSTYHGDRLIDGIRLAALASVTHDGLGEDAYNLVHRAVLHAAGQAAFPMLFALRWLRLLAPVKSENDPSSHPQNRNLSAAVARMGLSSRRKSQYNRLHHLLRLSHVTQANRSMDHAPVSPTYVYGGQHCPVVVRLAESIWANSVLHSPLTSSKGSNHQQPASKSNSLSSDVELIGKNNLVSALKLMGMSEEASSSLGLVSFADPSLTAAGYQSEVIKLNRRMLAPLAQPLPLLSVNQPVIVVFPGGCTYGEVAALRFAAARRRWQLLIVTSCLITSRDLLQQAGQAAVLTPNLA